MAEQPDGKPQWWSGKGGGRVPGPQTLHHPSSCHRNFDPDVPPCFLRLCLMRIKGKNDVVRLNVYCPKSRESALWNSPQQTFEGTRVQSEGFLLWLDHDMACCSSDKPGPPLLPSPANNSRVKHPHSVLNPRRVPGALSRVLFVYTLLVFVCLFLAFHGCDVTCRYRASQQPPIWRVVHASGANSVCFETDTSGTQERQIVTTILESKSAFRARDRCAHAESHYHNEQKC